MMYDDDGFVSVEECAQRMGLTVDEIWDLVEGRALRARRWGGSDFLDAVDVLRTLTALDFF